MGQSQGNIFYVREFDDLQCQTLVKDQCETYSIGEKIFAFSLVDAYTSEKKIHNYEYITS